MYHDAKSVIVSRERFKVIKSKHRIRIVKLLILLSQMFQIKIFLPNCMAWGNGVVSPRSRAQEALRDAYRLLHGGQAVAVLQKVIQAMKKGSFHQAPRLLFCDVSKFLNFVCFLTDSESETIGYYAPKIFPRRRADLTFSHLASLRGSFADGGSEESTYRSNGVDKARIRNVLKNQKASGCKCKRKYHVYFELFPFFDGEFLNLDLFVSVFHMFQLLFCSQGVGH